MLVMVIITMLVLLMSLAVMMVSFLLQVVLVVRGVQLSAVLNLVFPQSN